MRLVDLASKIGASVCCTGRDAHVGPDDVYAGDRISDLLNAAGDHALLVSNVAGGQFLRVAELMDTPGLCFVDCQAPSEMLIAAAQEHGTVLMVSPVGLFETCGRVYQCLSEERNADR